MDLGSINSVLLSKVMEHNIVNKERNIGDDISFSDVLTQVSNKVYESPQNMFSAAFPTYDVDVKVGNCDVSNQNWQRNDFPAWWYFNDNASVDSLNNWKPYGVQPTGGEAYIQKELQKIEYGRMVVIIPDSLQKRMEADPQYAQEIVEKVQKYKENYDRVDNALAASYGDNPELSQMTKRYCFQLDENGDVKNCWVVGGGIDTKQSSETQAENRKKVEEIVKRIATKTKGHSDILQSIQTDISIADTSDTDYIKIAPYIATSYKYDNKK